MPKMRGVVRLIRNLHPPYLVTKQMTQEVKSYIIIYRSRITHNPVAAGGMLLRPEQ
jgi:hypothetical protein